MLRKIIVLAALPAMLSCAPLQRASAASDVAGDEAALVDATCANTMGLRPGESYFANCRETLTQSLKRKRGAFAMVKAADACRDRGLPAGSAALALCMLDEKSRTGAQAPVISLQPVSLAAADSARQSGKSFYDVTPTVRWNRERYSCAQLGLPPDTGLFSQCVAGLEGAFLPNE